MYPERPIQTNELGYSTFPNWNEFLRHPFAHEIISILDEGMPLGIDFACSNEDEGVNLSSNRFCARLLSKISETNLLIALDPRIIDGLKADWNKQSSGNPSWKNNYPKTAALMIADWSHNSSLQKAFKGKMDIGVIVGPYEHHNNEGDLQSITYDALHLLKPDTGRLIIIPDANTVYPHSPILQAMESTDYDLQFVLEGELQPSGNISYLTLTDEEYQSLGLPDSFYVRNKVGSTRINVFEIRKMPI